MKIANLTSIGAVTCEARVVTSQQLKEVSTDVSFGKKKAIWAEYIYKLWTLFDTWTRVY